MDAASRDDGEHVHSLAAAYALDALDDLDRARVERHLAECDVCAAEVRSFADTTVLLASAHESDPPPNLRARVLEEVGRTRQLPPVVTTVRQSPRVRTGAPTRWLVGAAAGLLVLAVAAGAVAFQQYQAAERAQQFAAAVRDVLADPQRDVVDAEFADGHGIVMVSGDRVVVVGDGVDAPPADRTFQLWFIGEEGPRPSELLQSAGEDTFWVEADGLRPGDVIGVTVEPEGGSEQPTSDPVLVAQPAEG